MKFIIEKSVRNKCYVLYYQPKIDPTNNKIIGVECLVRLRISNEKILSPNLFIDKVYDMKLNFELFLFLLEQSIKDIGSKANSLSISINLKKIDFLENDISSAISNTCNELGFSPSNIIIELSEQDNRTTDSYFIKKINAIRALGVKISLDDFGIEGSNLDKLLDFPIDEVKFDRTILNTKSIILKKMVSSLVSILKENGIITVAEGIEDVETLIRIKKMNFDLVQGYILNKPVSIENLKVSRFA